MVTNKTNELLKTVVPAYRKSMNSKHGLYFPNWKCGPHKERKIFIRIPPLKNSGIHPSPLFLIRDNCMLSHGCIF